MVGAPTAPNLTLIRTSKRYTPAPTSTAPSSIVIAARCLGSTGRRNTPTTESGDGSLTHDNKPPEIPVRFTLVQKQV